MVSACQCIGSLDEYSLVGTLLGFVAFYAIGCISCSKSPSLKPVDIPGVICALSEIFGGTGHAVLP